MENRTLSFKLTENRGKFLKPCPGTPRHVCCGYQIINFAQGCNLGCTYCILNYYFSEKPMVLFNNREKLFDELKGTIKESQCLIRFGTGEFTDGLLLEKTYPLYEELIHYISGKKNAILEIKTKTANIEPLIGIRNKNNTIISWSLNSEYIAEKEERNAPGIPLRIDAADTIQRSGYKLSFHFDPLIHYEGWERGYKKTIDMLLKRIDPENIVYISMGTLRFMPEMMKIFKEKGVSYAYGEFIKGLDNKMRYFRPLRTRIYRKVLAFLRKYVSDEIIYLCMETSNVWEDVFGISDMNPLKLSRRLDSACFDKFPHLRV